MKKIKLIKLIRKICFLLSFKRFFLLPNKIMRNIFLNAKGTVEINDFDDDQTIELSLSEHMQSRIFWLGYYNDAIVDFLNYFIKPGMTIIDIGANIGEITLVAAKRVTHTGKVIAFEPVTNINSILNKNITKNGFHWVITIRKGLADKIGEATIFTSSHNDINALENIGLGSLYPMSNRQTPIETILLSTLDEQLKGHSVTRLDLIKIDIEGAEIPCLLGAQDTIRKFKPHIILETQEESYAAAGYSTKDLLNFFTPLNYEMLRVGKGGHLYPTTEESLNHFQNILARPIRK